jgi:glucose-1-phosphate cytidylyltransferase
MENLAADGQLAAWVHRGFWQPMDTLRDKQHLNSLWESGAAPWKLWQG